MESNQPGAGLPDFVRERMEDLGVRPSLRKLADLSGVPVMTLRQNLVGDREMKVGTAKRLAFALRVSIDELISACRLA